MKYNYFPKYANGDYFCSHLPFGPVKILSVKTIEKLKKASFPGEILAQKLSEIGSGDIELAHEFHFQIQERQIYRREGNIKPSFKTDVFL